MLPMYPNKPILTAGFIAPFLWTGLLRSALGVISPILNQRIDWVWFVVSQIAFWPGRGFCRQPSGEGEDPAVPRSAVCGSCRNPRVGDEEDKAP